MSTNTLNAFQSAVRTKPVAQDLASTSGSQNPQPQDPQATYVMYVVTVGEDGHAIETGFFGMDDSTRDTHVFQLTNNVHDAMDFSLAEITLAKEYIRMFNERAHVTTVPTPPLPKGMKARKLFTYMRGALERYAKSKLE